MKVKLFKSKIIFAFLLTYSLGVCGQGIKYSGIVLDKQTKEALAFVNLISADGNFGTTTDIDGKFKLVLPTSIDSIRFSYIGYETRYVLTRNLKGPHTVYLQSRRYNNTNEVFTGVNPAHRIISNAIRNRDLNDPMKLRSYSYTTYDKMVISIDTISSVMDSLKGQSDSVNQMGSFFKKRDLFLMETTVEKKYIAPDKSSERVLSTQVSGMKDPMIAYMILQIQSTSFYDEIIHIANKNYINPISKGSLTKYYFQMEDTLYSGKNDTVFTISFRPNLNTDFDGMQGILNISTNKWAVVNVKAEPAKKDQGISIQIQQKYDFIEGEHWFPVQLNANITFDGLRASLGDVKTHLSGIGKTYFKDIVLNPDSVRKAFSQIEIEIDSNVSSRKLNQLEGLRIDSLSPREKETYAYVDSVGRAANFDKTLKKLEPVLTGKVSWGYFDLLLNRFIGYNSFEGFWFGIGAQTNKRFSEQFSVGGYYAYSLKDMQSKYGARASAILYKPKEIKVHIAYLSDNIESGKVEFYNDENSLFDPLAFQKLFINRMNYTVQEKAGLSGRMFKYLQVYGGVNHEAIENIDGYSFQRPADLQAVEAFQTTEMQLQLRFAYKEKYFDKGRLVLSMGTKYPVFWFNYTQGFSQVFGGDFSFQKMDFQMRESFYTKYLGKTKIDIKAGIVFGDVPYAKLYSGGGTFRFLTLSAPGSFGTMRPNEFLSDRYVSLFITHNFGPLLFKGEKFKPEFELVTNIGFGWLKHPEYHQNVNFKIQDQGYYESGLLITNLLRLYLFNVGFGAIYRYGPYALDAFKDNVGYKITLDLPIKPMFEKTAN